MSAHRRSLLSIAGLALAASLLTAPVYANQLVYVPLDKPCRLLDTRPSTGGAGPLTAVHGAYLFGTSDADITAQHGNSAGCVPSGIEAISVNMNLLDATAAGNIATWSASAGSTAPNIGTAVYNPTVASPMTGQVQYNTGYTTVPVAPNGSYAGRFYLQVANGQIDMTINVVGYWLPISWGETRSGAYAIALGQGATAHGNYSIAMDGATADGDSSIAMGYQATTTADNSTALGRGTTASGKNSLAIGFGTIASGEISTAMGNQTHASGPVSTAMGEVTTASGYASIAMGRNTIASGDYSTAMGRNVSTDNHPGSFIYGDADTTRSQVANTADNQFVVAATGGVYFFSSCGATCTTGVGLAPGSGSWFSLSDRNAKTAVQPADGREVLKKVAALPLNTWQYKTQESKYRHMGPMAQDFYAAFQLGESDKSIDTVDADGVALAAIQGVNAVLADKEGEIGNLRAELATQKAESAAQKKQLAEQERKIAAQQTEIAAQKTRVASLESLAAELVEVKTQVAALRESAPKKVVVALQQP